MAAIIVTNNPKLSLLTLATGVFLTGFTAAPMTAFSQTSNDEIIVTATKQEQDAQDLGVSLDVLLASTLDDTSIYGAEDIVQHLSGVQTAIANGTQIAFQIRGIGAVDHQALTPTAASVYVDGVYLATNVQTGHLLFDLERAEILKGPQGTLYGRNASAGALNFISKKPTNVSGGYLHAQLGNFEHFNLNGAANTVINEDLALRVSGRYLSQGSTLENISTTGEAAPDTAGGRRNEFGLRALGAWTPSSKTDVLISLHYAEDNGINSAPLNSAHTLAKHEISIGEQGVQDTDNEFFGAAIDINHAWGVFDLYSQTAFEGYNQQYGFDFDGTQAPFGVPSLNANLSYDRDFKQWSHETRLSYARSGLNFMGGIYLSDDEFTQDYLIWCGDLNRQTLLGTCRYVGAPGRTGSSPASTGIATSLLSTIEQSRKTAAVFSYNEVAITDRFNLVAGARFTHETIKGNGRGIHIFDDGVRALNNRNDLGPAIGGNTINENRFSGNIGLNFKPNDHALLYMSYANGYKSGGFNGEVINNATHFQDEGLFEAEIVNALETGFKLDLSSTFRFNASAFYQFYAKPQARIFVPFTTQNGGSFTSNSLANLDDAISYGLESQITWSPFKTLNITGAATILETEIQQSIDPEVPDNFTKFNGNPLPFASKFSSVINVIHTYNLGTNIDMVTNLNTKYQSAFYLDAEGLETRKQDGYALVNGQITLHLKKHGLELGLWGNNITNRDYAVSGFGFIGYNTFRGHPRSYGISLKYTY